VPALKVFYHIIHVQETVSEPEGLSFEPAQWRDYMLDRLSNDGTSSSLPSPATSTSLASEGNATPILAVSSPAPDQPLVSPDSLLDPLEDQPPPAAACPECAHAQQMSSTAEDEADTHEGEELELTVEIKGQEGSQEEQQVFVAKMGPVGEDSCSDNHLDSNKSAVKDVTALPSKAAESANSASADKSTVDRKRELFCEEVSGDALVSAVSEEEELSSEPEYAREEEPAVDADSHLMADVIFSQQKLHELLNKLGKEDRYCSPSRTTETEETAAAGDAKKVETKEELSPKPEVASPAPEVASTAPEAVLRGTPERGHEGGDHETSDHIDRARLRKCSSLKSGRTPPGTPGVRKIVRWVGDQHYQFLSVFVSR